MGGDEENSTENEQRGKENFITGIIYEFYNQLLELGYLHKDLYEMTLKELEKTLENRRKGIGYAIYNLAILTHSPFIKNFPAKPEEACPAYFPIKKGIKMPDFLIDKAIKRGVL